MAKIVQFPTDPIERLLARWPDAKVGVVDTEKRDPVSPEKGGWKNWPEPVRQLQDDEVWAVVPGSMGFVVFDVDRDHDIASQLLVGLFGEPAAKVKSHHKGYHFWYPAAGEIGCPNWLCGEVRGTNGYIVLWRSEDLLDQLEGHSCLRSLNQADIRTATLKPKPKTKIETMLSHVSSDDYGTWIAVGMSLKSELGDDGLGTWEKWSQASDKFQVGACDKKWRGFTREGRVTLGTLYHLACEGGYKPAGGRPVTAGGAVPPLDRIVRVGDGPETQWELSIGDTTVRVTQAELCNQARFRTTWHAATGEVIRVKQAAWDQCIGDWWARAEVVEASSLDSVIWAELEAFCTDSQAMDIEELLNGLPYTDEDNITWLKASDFRLFLVCKRITVTMQRIWSAIRIQVEPLQKTVEIKGARLRVCGVPAFEQQDNGFSVPKVQPVDDF